MSNYSPAPADFAELIRAATLAAIRRTEARSPAAAAHARRNLEDITQAAALEALERLHADPAAASMDPAQLASRAANAAIRRAWYEASRDAARTTPDTITADDGTETPAADLDRRGTADRPAEDAATARAALEELARSLPPAYRADAPRVLAWTAAGYTAPEIARRTGGSARRIERIRAAARAAAAQE